MSLLVRISDILVSTLSRIHSLAFMSSSLVLARIYQQFFDSIPITPSPSPRSLNASEMS